ncbi:30S ribosomal protein S16, partial [Thermoproteota archaeon]
MAVKIRLKRMGKKKQPFYRVSVMEHTKPRDSRSIEDIGIYNPTKDPMVLEVDNERVEYWLSVGAQPTDTVQRLLTNLKLAKKQERKSQLQGVAK